MALEKKTYIGRVEAYFGPDGSLVRLLAGSHDAVLDEGKVHSQTDSNRQISGPALATLAALSSHFLAGVASAVAFDEAAEAAHQAAVAAKAAAAKKAEDDEAATVAAAQATAQSAAKDLESKAAS